MRILAILFICSFVSVASLNSCKKDKVQDVVIDANCPDTISFTTQVKPWVEQNCSTTGCHDAGATGGYNLIGHGNIATNASIILNVIRHDAGFTAMPIGGPQLPDSIIQQFECWIAQGTQNN